MSTEGVLGGFGPLQRLPPSSGRPQDPVAFGSVRVHRGPETTGTPRPVTIRDGMSPVPAPRPVVSSVRCTDVNPKVLRNQGRTKSLAGQRGAVESTTAEGSVSQNLDPASPGVCHLGYRLTDPGRTLECGAPTPSCRSRDQSSLSEGGLAVGTPGFRCRG